MKENTNQITLSSLVVAFLWSDGQMFRCSPIDQYGRPKYQPLSSLFFHLIKNWKRSFLQSPVDYVEDKEDDGEDDEEGDVDEGVVVLLPLAAAQLPKLHLHQDGSVPVHTFNQIIFIFGLRAHRVQAH